MAIVRGLAVNFTLGFDRCAVVEIALEDDGKVFAIRRIRGCTKEAVTTWLGVGLYNDHAKQLGSEAGGR